jgi:hypothetical protein
MLYRLSYEINFFIAGAKVGLFLINPNPIPIYFRNQKSLDGAMYCQPNAARIGTCAGNPVKAMGREKNVIAGA